MMLLSNCSKKYLYYALLILYVFVFPGCAEQGISSVNHRLNIPNKVESEKIFEKSYGEVWNELVSNLTESSYVIEKIDYESNIIKLSFVSSNPEKYVDCGETTRIYKKGNDVDTYIYNPAGSVGYRIEAKKQPDPYLSYFYFIERNTSLRTKSIIYIFNDNEKTKLSVETIYKLDIEVSSKSFAQPSDGNPFMIGKLPVEKMTVVFRTNSPETHIFDDGGKMTCSSKGKLERKLLSIVNE